MASVTAPGQPHRRPSAESVASNSGAGPGALRLGGDHLRQPPSRAGSRPAGAASSLAATSASFVGRRALGRRQLRLHVAEREAPAAQRRQRLEPLRHRRRPSRATARRGPPGSPPPPAARRPRRAGEDRRRRLRLSALQASIRPTPSSRLKSKAKGAITARGAEISRSASPPRASPARSRSSSRARSSSLSATATTRTDRGATLIFARGSSASTERPKPSASCQPSGAGSEADLQHVGDARRQPAGPERRPDHVAPAGLRHQPDQRDLRLVAQELEREGRRRQRLGGGERGRVLDAPGVDDLPGDLQRPEAAGLVGRRARQRHLQPVGGDARPALVGRRRAPSRPARRWRPRSGRSPPPPAFHAAAPAAAKAATAKKIARRRMTTRPHPARGL